MHSIFREVLLRDLGTQRRAELHLDVAKALEARVNPPTEQIALHYLEAEALLPELAPLVVWSLRAADHHHQHLAHEDAIALLERVRGVIERRNAPVQLAEVLHGLASGWAHAGKLERARTLCLTLIELARERKDADLLARAALVYGAEFDAGVVDGTLVRLLRGGARCAAESNVGIPALAYLARLAAALQPSSEPTHQVEMARQAIALARSTGDEDIVLAVLHNALAAMMDFADARERFALNLEQLELRAPGEIGVASYEHTSGWSRHPRAR